MSLGLPLGAQLEDFDPEWETREKGECEALNVVRGRRRHQGREAGRQAGVAACC